MLTFRQFSESVETVQIHVFSPKQGRTSPYHVVAYDPAHNSGWAGEATSIDDYDKRKGMDVGRGVEYPESGVEHPSGLSTKNVVGYARFVEHPYNNHHYAARVDVLPSYRRQKLATKMYSEFTKQTGIKAKPSEDQSVDGQAFWKHRLSESTGLKQSLMALRSKIAAGA